MQIAGIVGAQRFSVSGTPGSDDLHPFQYLAIYDLEAPDPEAVFADLRATVGTARMPRSDALAETAFVIAKAITPVVLRENQSTAIAPMSGQKLIVFSNPIEGRELEYNTWYSETHLADVVRLNGIVAAQRFKVLDGRACEAYPFGYLATYELNTEDVAALRRDMAAAAGTPRVPLSDALGDRTTVIATPISPYVTN